MASNPIQRRARQSFLIGFLIALVIMAVVVVFLFTRINQLNEEKEALIVKEITVYTAANDFKSGEKITMESLIPQVIRAELDVSGYITTGDFEYDEEGNPVEYTAKVDIPMGTLVTASMLTKEEGGTPDDERLMEYHMIVLPSLLQNGDYVDIRFKTADGVDYIVLSKKYVEMTTARGIWMKMTEAEINTLNSAIVESYWLEGSEIYANRYTEPGMQKAATQTYAVKREVLTAMLADPNIVQEAMEDLSEKWNRRTIDSSMTDFDYARNQLDSYASELEASEKTGAVEAGQTTESESIATARDEFVAAIEGSGMVGTNQ